MAIALLCFMGLIVALFIDAYSKMKWNAGSKILSD